MDSIKLTNEWKNDLELKVLYDIIKKPVQLGGFDIEHVYIKESIFNENNEHLQGRIKIEKNDLCLELILNNITYVNIFDCQEYINIFEYQELKDVTISIENGENDLVFLVKNINGIVISISFSGGSFNINNVVKTKL